MSASCTHSRLQELLHYDPETGVFTWRESRGRVSAGSQAGGNCNGYITIGVDGVIIYAHRLAWFYVHGEWPPHGVDHENEIKSDNRLSNLRLATDAQNSQNRSHPPSNNTSGYLGVGWDIHKGKWRARIGLDGKDIVIGRFDTPEEASDAYWAAKSELHPFAVGVHQ